MDETDGAHYVGSTLPGFAEREVEADAETLRAPALPRCCKCTS
jgi:hypothetical protein